MVRIWLLLLNGRVPAYDFQKVESYGHYLLPLLMVR